MDFVKIEKNEEEKFVPEQQQQQLIAEFINAALGLAAATLTREISMILSFTSAINILSRRIENAGINVDELIKITETENLKKLFK